MKKGEKEIINKRIFHNNSTPLLFENSNNNNKNNIFNSKPIINKKINFKKKLSPLITSNFKSLNKLTRNNNLSIYPFSPNSLFSLNNNNNTKKNTTDEYNGVLSRGDLANENANNIMNKYYYPDIDESHKNSNKINEEFDINKIMTFYSKLKYNKEKEEIKKIIKKQKKTIVFTNEEDNDNNYINNYNLIPSFSTKSLLTKNLSIDSYDKFNKFNNETNFAKNTLIRLDISKKIYHSPLHSLDTMKKNKLIYDYILNNYNINRIESYKGLEDKLRPLLKLKFNLDSKKNNNIKILPFIPKSEDSNYMLTNEEEGSNNKSKINIQKENNKESILGFTKLFRLRKGEKYLLSNTIQYPNKNFPESRSEFVFAQEGREFILHGGYNISRKNNLWKFNPNQKSWISIEPVGIKNEIRYAHTGVLHYRNLYIFGGKYFRGPNFADLEIFNLDKKMWIFPNLDSNKKIPLRRNHIACGVGNTMFIHGGIDEENKYLDDFYILNYKILKWEDIDINNSTIKIPPLAHHSCCLVVSEMMINNSKFNIYNYPETGRTRFINNIKEKGIYIFGGKQSNEGPINNNLYVIKIGKRPLDLIKLNTYGKQPCPRYNTSLNFYERENMLIVHGGRTLHKKKEIGLNDTFILDLFSYNWIEVEYFNKEYKVPPRFFHQAVIIKGDLLIFGGLNEKEYIGSEMLILDLNSNLKCLKEKKVMANIMNQEKKLKDKNNDNKRENKNEKSKEKNIGLSDDKVNKLKRIKII